MNIAKSVLLTDFGLCINKYRLSTPGIYVCIHVPVVLEDGTRIVPGLVAMVNHGRLKQCEPAGDSFQGPPNFVLDIFDESELPEYESRKESFGKAGVTEYVAIMTDEHQTCHWNRHNGETFETVTPDDKGVIKSLALPGLWFSTTHAKDRNWWALIDSIDYGVTRLGHHEFMETIFHKEGRKEEWGDWMPFESG